MNSRSKVISQVLMFVVYSPFNKQVSKETGKYIVSSIHSASGIGSRTSRSSSAREGPSSCIFGEHLSSQELLLLLQVTGSNASIELEVYTVCVCYLVVVSPNDWHRLEKAEKHRRRRRRHSAFFVNKLCHWGYWVQR